VDIDPSLPERLGPASPLAARESDGDIRKSAECLTQAQYITDPGEKPLSKKGSDWPAMATEPKPSPNTSKSMNMQVGRLIAA